MESHCLETLRNRRRELNYSQEYVAEKLGITQKTYSDIENGKTNLINRMRLKQAEILALSPNDLCSISGACCNIHKEKNQKLIKLLIQNKIEIPENLLLLLVVFGII